MTSVAWKCDDCKAAGILHFNNSPAEFAGLTLDRAAVLFYNPLHVAHVKHCHSFIAVAAADFNREPAQLEIGHVL